MISRGITCPNPDARMRTQKAPLSSLSNLIPFFRKTPACLQPPLIVLFSERCMHVFTRHRQSENLSLAFEEAQTVTLLQASQQLDLSERWVRHLIRQHGLAIRTVPWRGGYRFVFTRADLKRIWAIHERNQVELRRRHPAFFAAVGKLRIPKSMRSP